MNTFTNQIAGMHKRLDVLYRNVNTAEQLPSEIMPIALKELGIVSEQLQLALEALQQQNEELQITKLALEAQCQRYQELFDFSPNSYIATDTEGIITEVNCAAANLLNVSPHLLVGKPLVVFVTQEQRENFHHQVTQLQQGKQRQQRWTLRLLPRNLPPLDVALTVAKVSDGQGNLVGLRMCLRSINNVDCQLHSSLPGLNIPKDGLNSVAERPKQTYFKGEIIPIVPQTYWQVCKGVIKLSTICEGGSEVLVGLINSGMVFGATFTALPTYQATALAEVQLLSFSSIDMATAPHLPGSMFTQITQRLRQTEMLLAISGQRRVPERFYQLLQLMKQEIGQPIELGTRLSVRFTHQNLADACCTTRVTITRLIGRLREQGKIKFDAKNHLIIIS
jgi:PAS domain S-box-containing protein